MKVNWSNQREFDKSLICTRIETTIEPAGDYVKYANKKFYENFQNVPFLEAKVFRGRGSGDESYDEETRKDYRSIKQSDNTSNPPSRASRTKRKKSTGFFIPLHRNDQTSNDMKDVDKKEAFRKFLTEKSRQEYDQMRGKVIARLYELGMVKKEKKIKISLIDQLRQLKKEAQAQKKEEVDNVVPDAVDEQVNHEPLKLARKKEIRSISVSPVRCTQEVEVNPEFEFSEEGQATKKQSSLRFLSRFGRSVSEIFSKSFKKNVKHRCGIPPQ